MAKAATEIVCLLMGSALTLAAVMPFLVTSRSRASANDSADAMPLSESQARGRYLVRVAGCNDCHTPGFMQQGEAVPESEWLVGVPLGFKGPWGTSYAPNLRTKVQALSEDQWTTFAKNANGRPPMPWVSLHAMNDADLRSMYRYIKTLGVSDNATPAPLPPGEMPTTPYLVFEPVMPDAK